MTRSEARELAFLLLFEKTFNDVPMGDIMEMAAEARDLNAEPFVRELAEGTAAHLEELDALLSACSRNWKLKRISRVALSALRIAAYEMLYIESIPESVSINEAIELTKKYAGQEDASYVNGVLGAVSRRQGKDSPAPGDTVLEPASPQPSAEGDKPAPAAAPSAREGDEPVNSAQ